MRRMNEFHSECEEKSSRIDQTRSAVALISVSVLISCIRITCLEGKRSLAFGQHGLTVVMTLPEVRGEP
jgi:hypothetical protein